MKTKTATAPQRAGTKNGGALKQLNWLRKNRPRSYDRLMIALAEIVEVARGADD